MRPILAGILLIAAVLAPAAGDGSAVATTTWFEFHSDLATNVHDALLEAGRDRNRGEPELFAEGPETSCFEGLAPSRQSAWNRAVDFYAEVLSSKTWGSRPQYLLRMHLSGARELTRPDDVELVELVGHFIAAATPAFTACRWEAQDAANRAWVATLVGELDDHGEAVAARFADYYGKPFAGLPIRVDVVETVNWSGATTWLLHPTGGHILISKEEPGPESLELVFHEGSHTLMGRRSPVQQALRDAAERLDVELPDDLWHGVLFYTTGESVRRVLAEAGEPAYEPMMFADGIFRRYHAVLEKAWTPYLDGKVGLDEAAEALVRSVDDL